MAYVTACALGNAVTSYTDILYASADARLELYARDYGGNGMPVLCLHGLTRNSADFAALADHLAGRYRVIVPDVRGRGRSQWDDQPANYIPPVYVQDTFALMKHLGIARAAIVGTSMGGIMAMIMAALAPQMVAGMVLNDVGPELDLAGLKRIASYTGKGKPVATWAEAAEAARAINAVAFPRYGDADWMAFARRLFVEKDGVPVAAYDPAIAVAFTPPPDAPPPFDMWPMWDKISDIPVLSIRGELSDLLSPDTVAQMAARHAGMSAVTVPDVGHAPMLDEPAAIAAIDTFLENLEDHT